VKDRSYCFSKNMSQPTDRSLPLQYHTHSITFSNQSIEYKPSRSERDSKIEDLLFIFTIGRRAAHTCINIFFSFLAITGIRTRF
jgi:hypothetical protein